MFELRSPVRGGKQDVITVSLGVDEQFVCGIVNFYQIGKVRQICIGDSRKYGDFLSKEPGRIIPYRGYDIEHIALVHHVVAHGAHRGNGGEGGVRMVPDFVAIASAGKGIHVVKVFVRRCHITISHIKHRCLAGILIVGYSPAFFVENIRLKQDGHAIAAGPPRPVDNFLNYRF